MGIRKGAGFGHLGRSTGQQGLTASFRFPFHATTGRQLPFPARGSRLKGAGDFHHVRQRRGALQLVDTGLQGIQPLAHQRNQRIVSLELTGGQVFKQ